MLSFHISPLPHLGYLIFIQAIRGAQQQGDFHLSAGRRQLTAERPEKHNAVLWALFICGGVLTTGLTLNQTFTPNSTNLQTIEG